MKTLILILTLFSPIFGFAQLVKELPTDAEGKLNFNDVVAVEGLSKDDLYLNAKQFFFETFGSTAAEAIIRDDEKNGIIIGKGYFNFDFINLAIVYNKKMWFTIQVESRENRYRYQIYDVYFEDRRTNSIDLASSCFDNSNYYRKGGSPKPIYEKYLGHMASNIIYLVTSLDKTMKNHSPKLDESW